MAKCSGITQAGTACKGIPIVGSQWCYVHDPDHAEERRRHGARGGKRGGRGRPQAELSAIKSKLEDLAENVLSGSVDRSDAAVVAQIYNTVIRAVGVELKVREQQELIERLEELETALERQNGRGYVS
jgi:hypothetical protein